MRHPAQRVAALLTTGAAVLAAAALPARATTTGADRTYVVLYRSQAVSASAARSIAAAGGTVVASYDSIGVVLARSGSTTFRDTVLRDRSVEGVSATSAFATRVSTVAATDDGDLPNAPASDSDALSALQWDMRQIHTPEAHAVTGGSNTVLVGDIDTGLDFTHPDLAPNYDAANSADCLTGAPQPLATGNDVNGHGTHTAGTIAAAANGIGIVGVAPNVRIAGIKAGNDDGFFFPEAVICAFMWAGSHHVDVTNNSYYADPWLFNCRNDAGQRAIWKAEQRAIRYAMDQGVTVVAAEGNESEDLSHPGVDATSPDYPAGSETTRDVTNACLVIPTEIPGVVGVTSDADFPQPNGGYLKSFYSSYGVSSADVVAPGGDSRFHSPNSVNGRILSTWPSNVPCSRKVNDPSTGALYCYLQGTSMASPHAAGVAALIVSRYGSLAGPGDATMRPGAVAAYLSQTADPQPCPETRPAGYDSTTTSTGEVQQCQGGTGHNSWYGDGQVNAFSAVTR